MMRAWLPARSPLLVLAALALLAAAPASAQVTLGRLFATPAERAAMDAGRGGSAALLPNSQGVAPTPGMAGGPPATDPNAAAAAAAAQAAPASTLTMTGVLRSSDNRSVVFLNGVPQTGLKAGPQVLVTMPSGKKILLKPGQRYDLNESRIKDVNEP
jgi:hypothetical protein